MVESSTVTAHSSYIVVLTMSTQVYALFVRCYDENYAEYIDEFELRPVLIARCLASGNNTAKLRGSDFPDNCDDPNDMEPVGDLSLRLAIFSTEADAQAACIFAARGDDEYRPLQMTLTGLYEHHPHCASAMTASSSSPSSSSSTCS